MLLLVFELLPIHCQGRYTLSFEGHITGERSILVSTPSFKKEAGQQVEQWQQACTLCVFLKIRISCWGKCSCGGLSETNVLTETTLACWCWMFFISYLQSSSECKVGNSRALFSHFEKGQCILVNIQTNVNASFIHPLGWTWISTENFMATKKKILQRGRVLNGPTVKEPYCLCGFLDLKTYQIIY